MFFEVCLAGLHIGIESTYSYMKELCKDYINKDYGHYTEREYQTYKEDIINRTFDVCVTEEEILSENTEISAKQYPLYYLETLAILRKISEQLPLYQRLLIHGAAISYEGNGYIFTAPSGTGKTTHIRLWKQYLGEKVQIINGDKPFLQVEDRKVTVYGTPWSGKEGWHKNCNAPLKGIVFLRRGNKNRIRRGTAVDCLTSLISQIYLPKNPKAAENTLVLIDEILKMVPVYILECDMSEEAVQVSFEMLTECNYRTKSGNAERKQR